MNTKSEDSALVFDFWGNDNIKSYFSNIQKGFELCYTMSDFVIVSFEFEEHEMSLLTHRKRTTVDC